MFTFDSHPLLYTLEAREGVDFDGNNLKVIALMLAAARDAMVLTYSVM
jgi:hypothetical protein